MVEVLVGFFLEATMMLHSRAQIKTLLYHMHPYITTVLLPLAETEAWLEKTLTWVCNICCRFDMKHITCICWGRVCAFNMCSCLTFKNLLGSFHASYKALCALIPLHLGGLLVFPTSIWVLGRSPLWRQWYAMILHLLTLTIGCVHLNSSDGPFVFYGVIFWNLKWSGF